VTGPTPAEPKRRRTGRHPAATTVVVRLTEPAFDDLQALLRLDPQLVRQALKKMLLLERDPQAGESLHGSLSGYRKLVLGDRDRRIIWRVTHDDSGTVIVDVAEVWAVGARRDDEVYDEMRSRVKHMTDSPATVALAEVIERLGRAAASVEAAPEPQKEPVPSWLAVRLEQQVGLTSEQVQAMTPEAALDVWTEWASRPR
jgi:mRNA interferase RelE/StbE